MHNAQTNLLNRARRNHELIPDANERIPARSNEDGWIGEELSEEELEGISGGDGLGADLRQFILQSTDDQREYLYGQFILQSTVEAIEFPGS